MSDKQAAKQTIEAGKSVLGIEFGSTRIKAVLVDEKNIPIASGSHEWENRLENGLWTYSLDDIWDGLRDCYADLVRDVKETCGAEITAFGAIGFSAMMHGYMAFNEADELLVPFRTWRNTNTEAAARELTELFQYNMPMRWSVSHVYQAVLNGEPHVPDVRYITTLSGYIHWKMTGRKVLGVGDASGMFPIDNTTHDFSERMLRQFDEHIAAKKLPWKLRDILPQVLTAGEDAGTLTEEGAKLLDPTGKLRAGIPLCPPEGDAGTGMAATNSVAVRTGNVSAGTSIFAMIVLEKDLSKLHTEIDMVTTPAGDLVAMAHCNNCTTDLNAWVNLFKEFTDLFGMKVGMNDLFGKLYNHALTGDDDCGGLLSYNYYSGEPMTGFEEGRPLFVRKPDSKFSLANFMRMNLYSTLGALKVGMDILVKEEHVQVDQIMGHGGLFKTKGVGQKIMADAMDTAVTVMETAGEGGAWGIALLASYLIQKADGETLTAYLSDKVFAGQSGSRMEPDAEGVKGFERFMKTYLSGLPIEKAAVESI